ncbi:Hypothetical protein CINCED_3A024963 [Cinara cedri]|uniref:Uncharacterized protein n=1 Tax=Cinara cedri TaxID=506608 RepID=A0A5E4NMT5_9HEMI|nr:Hypothetical protein CINCED_3A024963 [Cinara cedri]
MAFNATKLVFYTLIVHVIVPDIPSKVTTTFGSTNERSKFNNIVNEFQKKYNLKKGAEIITQHQNNHFGKIPGEFITFEIDLFLILQQMAYMFDKRSESGLMYEDYFLKICSILPRCLDFININVFQNSITVMLNKIHIVLCYSLPTYFKTYINASPNNIDKKFVDKTIERNLASIVSMTEIKTNNSDNLFEQPNYKNESLNFISKVYEIIGNIDFISCMSENLGKLKQHLNEHNSHNNEIKFKVTKVITRDNKIQINSENNVHFLELNKNYTNELRNKCGFKIQSHDLSKLKTMQHIVFYTLKKLKEYFTNILLNGSKKRSQKIEKDLGKKYILMDTLNKMCQKISLILVYLNKNEVDDDSIIFRLYLTFCADFKEYTDIRCTSAFNGTAVSQSLEAERNKCIRESVKNIWTWNIFITTIEVPKKSEDKYLTNENCKILYLNYLENIHNTIKQFHKGMGVWTTFEWLSGKYVLTESSQNTRMHDIKSKNINIKTVNMSLSVAYYATLPWGLNTFSVGNFHNVVVNHLDSTMNTYVYIYAKIIDLYLERTGITVESHVLQSIRDSIRWHNEGTKLFYKYLYLPLYTDKDSQDEPQPTDDIKTIIYRIQNIDDSGNISLNDIIPEHDKDNFLEWSETKLPNNDEGYKQFNTFINGNCMDAMDFMSTFFSIVEKSMDINFEFHSATTMYSQYCPENIFDVKSAVKLMSVVRDQQEYTEAGSKDGVIGSSSPGNKSNVKTLLMGFLKLQ